MKDEPQESNANPDEAPDSAGLQLAATAYHEAGHAVMAISLGRSIQKVTIQPGKSQRGQTQLGVCEIQKGRFKPTKNMLEDDVLILFAGMVAEARSTGQYCHQGASQDIRAIERMLEDRARNESQMVKLQRRLLDKAEHILHDEGHSHAIELIARELIEKTTISGRAVRHFFDQAMKQFS